MSKASDTFTLWETLLSDRHALQKAMADSHVKQDALTYNSVVRMIPDFNRLSSEERNAVMVSIVAQFRELRPSNPIERMLVTQIIGLHLHAIDYLQSAHGSNVAFEMRDTQLKQAMSLMDHCLKLMNAFEQLRAPVAATETAAPQPEPAVAREAKPEPVREEPASVVDIEDHVNDRAEDLDIDFDLEFETLVNRNARSAKQ